MIIFYLHFPGALAVTSELSLKHVVCQKLNLSQQGNIDIISERCFTFNLEKAESNVFFVVQLDKTINKKCYGKWKNNKGNNNEWKKLKKY